MRRRGTTQRSRGFSRGGKCSGRAGKQSRDRVGAVRDSRCAFLPGETPLERSGGESAEAIVASREPGAGNARLNSITGRLDAVKGRTEQEPSDRVEDIVTADAGRQGSDERRHGGKHRRFESRP